MIIILAIIGIGALLVMWGLSNYNKFIELRNRVRNGWGQIDIQLQRRYDLIPNLVNTVKGYATHESQTFEKVTQARNMAMSATTTEESIEANNQLSSTLKTLFAVSEAYPELKADQSFIQLQTELGETEDKIAFARQFYNDTVTIFNTAIQKMPQGIIANLFGFKEEPQYKIENIDAKVAPNVQF